MKPVDQSVWSGQKEQDGCRFRALWRKLHLQDGNQTRHRSHERSASSPRDRSGTLARPNSGCFPEKEISRGCLRLHRFAAFFENIIVDRVNVPKFFSKPTASSSASIESRPIPFGPNKGASSAI